MKKTDCKIFGILFITSSIFMVGYCSYPFVISYFISVEQANRCNMKKFENNREFFQTVIDACMDVYSEQSKTDIGIEGIPINIQNTLKRKGIGNFYARIETKDGQVNIIANFYIPKFWHNDVLNNVGLYYSSYRKFDVCNDDKTVLKVRGMSIICLGDGWFFEVDTDWI
jgi:hypothetical protein